MKKIMILCLSLFVMVTAASADSKTPVQVDQMPSKAQNFIKKHFGDTQVAYARMDNGLVKSYEVEFVNGNTIDFDKDGEWTDVECKAGVVPEGIVPNQIVKYVEENHPNRTITGIERERRGGYKIDLNNGLELEFNKDYRLMDVDR